MEEEALGPKHIQTSDPIYNLAFLYFNQCKYAQAEPLFQRALQINMKLLRELGHVEEAIALESWVLETIIET